jgi:hypothetical protein
MCFSNRYASNISRLINLKNYRLYKIKSHDCHVFMQKKIIALTYMDLLQYIYIYMECTHGNLDFMFYKNFW